MLNIPLPNRKLPKTSYKKPVAVKILEQLATDAAMQKHPTVPSYALAPRTFRDDQTNSLTLCIVTYITLKSGFASRVNNGGIYDSRSRKYRPGTSKKGLPDILATYKGLSLFIEVKINRDKQSIFQKEIQIIQVQAGGHYYIAKNFTDFKFWFDNLQY